MKTTINYIASTLLTTIVYYLGGLDTAMKTLLILMVLDYATGICKSIVNIVLVISLQVLQLTLGINKLSLLY